MPVENNISSLITPKINTFTILIAPPGAFAPVEKTTKLDLKVQKTDTEIGFLVEWKDILAKKSNAFGNNAVISG